MDAETGIPLSGNGDIENGLHQKLPISANANGTSNGSLKIEGLCENLEDAVKLNDDKILNSTQEITEKPDLPSESHSTNNPKELGVKESDDSKNLKPLKGMVKAKNGKSLSKGKDAKEAMKPSNGNIAFRTKSKSFNDKQSASVQNKLHGIPDATSSSTSGEQSEDIPEKTKLKALKKCPASKTDDISQSSSSPTAVDAKPVRLGTLPAYSFSFKCNERAEKRKEFYSELEKKIQAKEAEKSNLQAKSKETQDAEIRMMRKKLGFKATPMPSFYQEPAPPKAELKKIPTTRAKSPKLGRKKSSPTADNTKENGARPARLSLDAKLSQSKAATRADHIKNPHRQSLPRLPFEDPTNFSYEKKRASSRKTTISKKTGESEVQPNNIIEETGEAAGRPIENQSSTDEELPEAQEVTVEVQEA
ncbi:protein wave-dampened 2 [Phtheirospermum japonicum]|uniref:Protein wave-dampened 2 n=1 Tax=Phtheirospermum japonicum TaxID=374723 RepID=A0A830BJM9_9LAMI|nr:protein wave-dampened 2 [Phtheirospermum japonicum]